MKHFKECTKCKKIKHLDNFRKSKRNKDGHQKWCKSCQKEYLNNYLKHNKEKDKLRRLRYRSKESTKFKRNEYNKNKYHNDINFKIKSIIRSRLVGAIKNNQKYGSGVSDLGCTIEEFKRYIESQFKPGMTWDNWSKDGWHLDHIIPLSKFDLSKEEEFKKAVHFTNLQPLWAVDNIIKGG